MTVILPSHINILAESMAPRVNRSCIYSLKFCLNRPHLVRFAETLAAGSVDYRSPGGKHAPYPYLSFYFLGNMVFTRNEPSQE